MQLSFEKIALGKKSEYEATYNPTKLFPILRSHKRADIAIFDQLPFVGFDIWNHYEVSWLNEKGKPIVAIAQLIIDCASLYLIESKSMKLYFNTFNNTKFKDTQTVAKTIKNDIEKNIGSSIEVIIKTANTFTEETLAVRLPGICLDDLDIECSEYEVNSAMLLTENEMVEESVYSNLLKSNCLVTGQPDWGSVQISYQGKKINHANLLRYIVSFRNHCEFGEHCIERIFMDIMQRCAPIKLTVQGRYTRRGGIDISAIRSTEKVSVMSDFKRLWRE